jgi:O-antigen/teichoic acid export membrane protein
MTALDPGLSMALQQRVGNAYGEDDQDDLAAWIGAGVVISLALSVFVATGGLLFGDILIGWLDLPAKMDLEPLKSAFSLAVVATGLSLFSYAFSAINLGMQLALPAGIIYVSVNATSIALIAWLVWTGHGVMSIAWGMVFRGAGWLLGNAGYLFFYRILPGKLAVSLRLGHFKKLLRLTTFTFLGRIGGTLANHVDAFVVARFLGPQTVTLFEMTRRAPSAARPLVERLSNAVMPSVSSLQGEGRRETLRRVLSRLLTIMGWVLSLMVAGFACFNDDFVRLWLGEEFFAGTTINLLIVVGLLFGIGVRSLSNFCMALGNIEGNSVVTFIESLVFVILLYFGVTEFGLIGVVIAPIVAKLCVSAWYYPRAFGQLLDLPARDFAAIGLEFLKALMMAGGLSALFWSLRPTGWVEFVSYAVALTAAYGVLLLFVSARFRVESRFLVDAFKRRMP